MFGRMKIHRLCVFSSSSDHVPGEFRRDALALAERMVEEKISMVYGGGSVGFMGVLADRILVLKAHPGEVQELIEVPVPHPRGSGCLLTPEFLATRAHIEKLIHPPAEESYSLSEEHLNLVRMVKVGDAVSSVF